MSDIKNIRVTEEYRHHAMRETAEGMAAAGTAGSDRLAKGGQRGQGRRAGPRHR